MKESPEKNERGWLLKMASIGEGQDLRSPDTGMVKYHQYSILDFHESRLDSEKADFCGGFMNFGVRRGSAVISCERSLLGSMTPVACTELFCGARAPSPES